MLGQKLDLAKSQTLPRLDGQDEGETLESQFEILSIATNSCPDLSIEMDLQNNGSGINSRSSNTNNTTSSMKHHLSSVNHMSNSDVEDVVDGIFYKNSGPLKMPLSFRRSTSLNSLTADEAAATVSSVDGNNVSVMKSGNVAKVIGKLEARLGKQDFNSNSKGISTDYLRSTHNGTGTLHKSISTPSVPQIFGASGNVNTDHLRVKNITHLSQRGAPSIQSSISQSSKRSFFRRKQKSKSNSINSHPPVVVQHRHPKMESPTSYNYEAVPDEESQESIGYIALSNPALGLQDPDIESWQAFMGKDFAAQLDRKEVKRQEHMNELIVTEKHHCLNLALMHHLFVGGMKKAGYTRPARLLFPGLVELLQIHFSFLKKMRERQVHFRDLGQPMDTLSDLIIEQFTGENWHSLVRLYGLLCSSLNTSHALFKALQKDSKFAALVLYWSKEPLLARKNVPECLLLVAQRITKYHLLFEALVKTAPTEEETEKMMKGLSAAKDLNTKVNQRVYEREHLEKFCQKMDSKSMVPMGKRRIRKEDLTLVPSRRLLFTGHASVSSRVLDGSGYNGNGPGAARNLLCNILILTDSLIFTQEIGGRIHFVAPPILPGIVMLNHLIVRENAGQNSSLFLVLGTGSVRPEMIELQVIDPPNRDRWIETIRDAVTRWEETRQDETLSDGDEEFLSDTVEYQDIKTARALEELQDQDRQILQLLRSRTKLVETLRTDKPRLWTANSFDGKDEVLSALCNASTEVQKMMGQIDANNLNGVNVLRSASCASEHMTSASNSGLPRRADTFGGFDSQQRSNIDFAQSVNNKVLFQMVIQLADLCGEMFTQMIPHLTPPTNQNQHQLQRRMEDLREAQQRLETEKAEWQRALAVQKEEIERQQTALKNKSNLLQEEEKDIIQQREQLYRKLEALQRQGIRPNLDSVSPGSTTSVEKSSSSVGVPPRRTVSQTQLPISVTPQAPNPSGKQPKQQIPHFLANSTSVKSSPVSPTGIGNSGTDQYQQQQQQQQQLPPKPLPRGISSSLLVAAKPPQPPNSSTSSIANSNTTNNNNSNQHSPGEYILSNQGKGISGLSNLSSSISSRSSSSISRNQQQQPVQILPMRLSEGLKTSSLPRGVGSRSSSSMNHSHSVDQQQLIPNSNSGSSSNNSRLRNSSSASHVLHHSHSTGGMYAGGDSTHPSSSTSSSTSTLSSYLYGPANDRMSSYYKNTTNDPRKGAANGYMEFPYGVTNSNNSGNNSSNIIHRRAGSSPVPMTSMSSNPTGISNHHPHNVPNQDDLDSNKILFL